MYAATEGAPAALPDAGMPSGAPPRIIQIAGNVCLVVSDVPADTYNAEFIDARLSDLDWVGEAGAAHHAVVDALAAGPAVVVPFRLLTIFSSDLTAVVTARELLPAMQRAFDRVRGRQEWVLRIGKPDAARLERDTRVTATSGTSFLALKAAAKREAAERSERVKADSAAACETLQGLAEAAKVKPVDASGNLLVDAAFLVTPERVPELHKALTRSSTRLLEDGCPVSLTGPWPPYSFASVETSHHG